MKTHNKAILTAIMALGMVGIGNAAVTILAHSNQGTNQGADAIRTIDLNIADGTGDALRNANTFVGYFGTGHNLNSTLSFQMIGIAAPATITAANFTATQGLTNTPDGIDVTVHVVRADSSGAIQASDHNSSELELMANFDGAGAAGAVSLDAAGQALLATWLQTNWVENDYVFIGLQSDAIVPTGSGTEGLTYNDEVITITTVPEPSSAALLGLGGLALILRRRK